MMNVHRIFFLFFIVQIIYSAGIASGSTVSSAPPRPIQIIVPENHSFRLNADELLSIVKDNDNLKNRQLVVMSIAGPHRLGKSFLMNFFIRFLDAQVNFKSGQESPSLKMS